MTTPKAAFQRSWVGCYLLPKKLHTNHPSSYADVFVDVPDELDLSILKGSGPQCSEELLPEGEEPKKMPEPNPEIVTQLQAMGFPELHCKKAALNSGTLTLNCIGLVTPVIETLVQATRMRKLP